MDWLRPSFFGFITQGLLIGIFLILFIKNYNSLTSKEIMNLTLFSSIAIGVHSMIHYKEEQDYGFNPIRNIIN
jgi:hypothetical protein